MPAARPSASPFRNTRLIHQAERGALLTMTCRQCRRTVRFWAADLVQVLGPDHQAHVPLFPCGRCRTAEWLDWAWSIPSAAELASGLTVRRPVRKVERWLWRNEQA